MVTTDFISRAPKNAVSPAETMYPEFYRAVKHLLRDDFTILNIGANDGVDNDPIYPFLLMYPQWRGICVEPVHYNFSQLSHNYQKYRGIKLVQAAVGDRPSPVYYIDSRSGCDMNYVSQCCSFDRDYVLDTLATLRESTPDAVSENAEKFLVVDHSIPCMSVEKILQDNSVECVDFLNIDVEGFDYLAFKQFDVAKYKPAIICVETITFSSEEQADFQQVMSENNYHLVGIFGLFSPVYIRAIADDGEFDFDAPPAHFTPADVAREKLDEYEVGSTLRFDGSSALAYLVCYEGWAPPSNGYCWSRDVGAALNLRIPDRYFNTELELVIEYRAFVDSDVLPAQTIQVSINGVALERWVRDKPKIATERIRIPSECVDQNDLHIQFEFPDAANLKSLGLGQDKRKLGIALYSLRLVSVDYEIGTVIEFSESSGIEDKLLTAGWAQPLNGYCWSTENRATLQLRIPNTHLNTPLVMALKYRAFIHPEVIPAQAIYASIDGVPLEDWTCDNRKVESKHIRIPQERVSQNELIIQLELPDAASPETLGLGSDTRKLGIALYALELVDNNHPSLS